jgi:predicted HTH transcriptional regulator
MKEIAEIISQGEPETLEFKERFNTDVIETAVAFANTRGGRIVIGVSDFGKPINQHSQDSGCLPGNESAKTAVRELLRWLPY